MTTAPLNIFILMHRSVCKVILLLSFFLFSCNKNKETVPANNDEVNATVVLSSGNTIAINSTGTKASVTKDVFGFTYINGTNNANAGVNLSFQNVTIPGFYTNYFCEYRVDATSQSTPIYVNALSATRGSITITIATEHHIEGIFTATCKTSINATDSAMVTGSFKGDY